MTKRSSGLVSRVVIFAALAVIFTLAASPSVWAQGTTDADLRGYKGGLVEIGLKGGATVRGMLLSYTSEHVELEVTKGRMVKVHRSRLVSLKAAPAGAAKSEPGAFPPDAGLPYSAGARRAAAAPPSSTDPRPTASENPVGPTPGATAPGPTRVTLGRGPKAKGLVFELKIGGTLYMPYVTSGYHASAPVSADVLLGYKFGRFLIGMRVDYVMVEQSWEDSSGDKMIGRMWALLFAPTFQITLMESWPLAMYGTMSVDIGPGVTKDWSPWDDDYTIPVVGFRAGAGMRYFVHPRFAIGAEAGVRGFWMLVDGERLGNVNIYGQASLFFIW